VLSLDSPSPALPPCGSLQLCPGIVACPVGQVKRESENFRVIRGGVCGAKGTSLISLAFLSAGPYNACVDLETTVLLKWRYISVQPNLSRRDLLATAAASVAAAGVMGAGCMEQNRQIAKGAKTLAMCGLDCAACPAFVAYKTNDQAVRVKTAAEWSRQFRVQFNPEDINCVGCLKTKGVLFRHCRECEVRQCGLARKVENCALCPEYSSCEKIGKFIANVPPAKANLEEVRRARQR
jgi:hypothetical protein